MTITASCGHRIPDNSEKYSVAWKSHDLKDNRVINHGMVCMECQEEYRQWGIILDTEAEEQAWVNYDDPL